MLRSGYFKKLIAAIMGAAIAIPSIAVGFYLTYQLVTFLGN